MTDFNDPKPSEISSDFYDLPFNVVDDSGKPLEPVTNQGYGHSLNPAPIMSFNVRHRTYYEAYFTSACIRRQDFLYFPLPLVLWGKKRTEPDAFFVKDGMSILVELDGPSHNEELSSDEQLRLKPFRDNLVHVMRFSVPDITDFNWANGVLEKVLDRFDKLSRAYGRER